MPEPAPRAKAPSYQWYPGDFKRDVAVQACSFEARGLWREMMDLMHDGEPYGHLTAGGIPIKIEELSRIIGKKTREVRAWMDELESRKVFSRTNDGVIFSRRMVRDHDIRSKRAAGGSKGGNPKLLKDRGKVADKVGGMVNLPANLPPTPAVAVCSLQSASAEEQIKEKLLSEQKEKRPWKTAPSDWQPNDQHREYATDHGIDFEHELAKFRDHRFKDAKINPDSTFRNWLRVAAERLGTSGNGKRDEEQEFIDQLQRELR